MSKTEDIEMAHTKKAVPGHGEGGGDSRRKGQVGAETKK